MDPRINKFVNITLFQFSLAYYMKNVDVIRQFIHSEIEQHRDTYDPENMRDLVDLYIQAEKNDFKDTKGMDGTIRALGLFTLHFVKKDTCSWS